MKDTIRLLVRLLPVLAVLATLAGGLATARGASGSAAGRDLLVLRVGNPQYSTLTALRVRSAHYTLPAGIFDRAGRTLYVAQVQNATTSVVQAIDTRTGRVLRSTTVTGYYTTSPGNLVPGALLGGGGAGSASGSLDGSHVRSRVATRRLLGVPPIDTTDILSALSYDGRWLALRDATVGTPDTNAVVIDTTRMRVVATLRLRGAFGLDALDRAGRTLYLIERRDRAGPQAYWVRAYDLRARRLDAAPLTEPDDPSGIIRGVAYTRVWSPGGDWLYTLYVQPGAHGAFIHALGVTGHRVHCIMLPGEVAGHALTHDALAVAPDGTTLYAVNPVLGRMVTVHNLPDGRIVRTALDRHMGSPPSMQRATALSRDGRTLFVATDRGIWAVAPAMQRVHALYAEGTRVSSLALSVDGARLYALEPTRHQVQILDAASGRVLASVTITPTAAGDVWAIEQVTSA